MATIVGLARDNVIIETDEFQKVEIVDGQQRLTTLIILLKAIELASIEESLAKIKREINELLVKRDDHAMILLQTNHDSSSIFADFLRDGTIPDLLPKTDADQNLLDAIKECREFVDCWGKQDDITNLLSILKNRLSAIYHEIDDESTVYRVFEVLNSRGLDVRWIDKVKSQFMGLIFSSASSGVRAESLHEMHELWKDVYRSIGLRADLGDDALRFAGTWKAAERENRILSQEDAVSRLVEFAGSTLPGVSKSARWLKQVVDAACALDSKRRLRAVSRISHARFVAIGILLRHYPPTVEAKVLREWEKVTFRIYGLGGADTRHKVGDYVRLGYDLVVLEMSEAELLKRPVALGGDYSIKTVLEKIDWSDCYNNWAEEIRYLLYWYDEHLSSEAGEKMSETEWNRIWATDPSKSIEHIMSQSSGAAYVHHLGNLTMLPPNVNSSLKDRSPSDKADVYQKYGLRGTSAVANVIKKNGWKRDLVLERAEKLERFVKKEWS